MILDKEFWCDSLIPIVILEAIDMIRNQLPSPRLQSPAKKENTWS